jgi:hypothetical protein
MARKVLIAALATVGAFAALVPSAFAADQTVAGTTLGTLSLSVNTPAAFGSTLSPGTTATGTGGLLATSTNPSWTLSAKDAAATTPGKMDSAGGPLCTGSESSLQSAVSVTISGGGTSAGPVTLSGVDQKVASAGGSVPTAPLAAAVLTTGYSQAIASTEVLTTGCVYSLTATYTLQ